MDAHLQAVADELVKQLWSDDRGTQLHYATAGRRDLATRFQSSKQGDDTDEPAGRGFNAHELPEYLSIVAATVEIIAATPELIKIAGKIKEYIATLSPSQQKLCKDLPEVAVAAHKSK